MANRIVHALEQPTIDWAAGNKTYQTAHKEPLPFFMSIGEAFSGLA
jgi:hypothetical protein